MALFHSDTMGRGMAACEGRDRVLEAHMPLMALLLTAALLPRPVAEGAGAAAASPTSVARLRGGGNTAAKLPPTGCVAIDALGDDCAVPRPAFAGQAREM